MARLAGLSVTGSVSSARRHACARPKSKKLGVKRIGDNRMKRGGHSSFGEDYDPSYGAASNSGGSRPDTQPYGTAGEPGVTTAGLASAEPSDVLSPDEVAQLSPEQQGVYLKRLRGNSARQQMDDVPDLAAIEAGSRARSGSTASD